MPNNKSIMLRLNSLSILFTLMVNYRRNINGCFLCLYNSYKLQTNKQRIIGIPILTNYRISRPFRNCKITTFLRAGSLGIS